MRRTTARVRGQYIRADERQDVVASLELCALLLTHVRTRPQIWKWLLIAAHNAVQGGMVCALSGTTGTGALDKKSAAEMLDFLQDGNPSQGSMPSEKLADFNELLKRARRAEAMQYLDGKPLDLTPAQTQDLKKLHDLRNRLVHFTPKGWSIEMAGLPRIIGAAIEAATQLMAHPSVDLQFSPAERKRHRSAIKSIHEQLSAF